MAPPVRVAGDQFKFPLIDFVANNTTLVGGWGSVQVPPDRLQIGQLVNMSMLGISSSSP